MLSTSLTSDIINCYSALYGQRYLGGTQANAGRISPLKSLVRQLQYSLHRWEMVALRAVSCTSVRSIRTLTRPLTTACRQEALSCRHIQRNLRDAQIFGHLFRMSPRLSLRNYVAI